jgi:hypothetical protein
VFVVVTSYFSDIFITFITFKDVVGDYCLQSWLGGLMRYLKKNEI